MRQKFDTTVSRLHQLIRNLKWLSASSFVFGTAFGCLFILLDATVSIRGLLLAACLLFLLICLLAQRSNVKAMEILALLTA
jgi:hypothetical protein